MSSVTLSVCTWNGILFHRSRAIECHYKRAYQRHRLRRLEIKARKRSTLYQRKCKTKERKTHQPQQPKCVFYQHTHTSRAPVSLRPYVLLYILYRSICLPLPHLLTHKPTCTYEHNSTQAHNEKPRKQQQQTIGSNSSFVCIVEWTLSYKHAHKQIHASKQTTGIVIKTKFVTKLTTSDMDETVMRWPAFAAHNFASVLTSFINHQFIRLALSFICIACVFECGI